MKIGILALQGAFAEHEASLDKLHIPHFEIRQADDLQDDMDGLIIPGGESTVMGKLLKELGYSSDWAAENGVKAVEKYQETKPDLVLMDITMPEMDGIQALKKIKAIDANASVVMCSAMGQQAMVIESIQSGAKDFIVKPFQADRVLEAVRKVVG